MDVSEDELTNLYTWVDEIPLSRPKRNIARDFADGVLMAEVVHHYFPRLVELHNYSSANGIQQKLYNWNTLNQKAFRRLGFMISKQDCEAISTCQPGAIERVLKLVKLRIAKYRDQSGSPDGDFGDDGVLGGELESGGDAPAPGSPASRSTRQTAPKQLYSALQTAGPAASSKVRAAFDGGAAAEIIADREAAITELRDTNELLDTKVRKLEQLVKLKDAKIQTLMAKLQAAGLA